jgi:AcrR family transcriptional regulator
MSRTTVPVLRGPGNRPEYSAQMPSSGRPRSTGSARAPGRPRLYEPDAERNRILAAALEVLSANQGREATVADILEHSGLSTRAFYRHFETKEDVIRALYRRDAQSFGDHLCERVTDRPPREALEVWINELLGLAYDRRRAERASTLSSPIVQRVIAGGEEQRLGLALLAEPLRAVLVEGLASGEFGAAQPELDVLTILAMVFKAIAWARTGAVTLTRRQAVNHLLRFALPALQAGAN